MARTAKLFCNGRGQAAGEVAPSRRPDPWPDFFELMKTIEVPEDFLSDRGDQRPQKRKCI